MMIKYEPFCRGAQEIQDIQRIFNPAKLLTG